MTYNEESPILTKIIATLGPASANVQTLVRMIEEGVRVVRINFSHGKIEDFERMLKVIREASNAAGEPIAALGDLCGPKIRCLGVEGGTLELEPGDQVCFTKDPVDARRDPETGLVTVGTTFPEIIDDAEAGHRLLVNDGAIRMLIIDKSDDEPASLTCSVTVGGTLSPKKGINLPDSDLNAPSLTEWDRRCAGFAYEKGFDYLALSFVRKAEDVEELKSLLCDHTKTKPDPNGRSPIPIIAKIEMPQAIEALDGIIDSADGVMVARGDLGVELDLARVPILQKQIIKTAHNHGKPVIVATQMLESMIDNASPTRAEVSDVANAILDGADATMLSGETAVGKFPVPTVHYMGRTARRAEQHLERNLLREVMPPKHAQATKHRPAALAHGVSVMVRDLHAKCVVMWTASGGGVRYMSQNRLAVPIVALCEEPAVLRQMALMFGVRPVYAQTPSDPRLVLDTADQILLERGWADRGDPILVARGFPMGVVGTTNTVQVHYVGDVCRI
ncbi:MAG: pyruvate kinase [Phycisphaeraceae bacterium]|nr:pyruvate kinase [Phycisphaeraceae bacterium]